MHRCNNPLAPQPSYRPVTSRRDLTHTHRHRETETDGNKDRPLEPRTRLQNRAPDLDVPDLQHTHHPRHTSRVKRQRPSSTPLLPNPPHRLAPTRGRRLTREQPKPQKGYYRQDRASPHLERHSSAEEGTSGRKRGPAPCEETQARLRLTFRCVDHGADDNARTQHKALRQQGEPRNNPVGQGQNNHAQNQNTHHTAAPPLRYGLPTQQPPNQTRHKPPPATPAKKRPHRNPTLSRGRGVGWRGHIPGWPGRVRVSSDTRIQASKKLNTRILVPKPGERMTQQPNQPRRLGLCGGWLGCGVRGCSCSMLCASSGQCRVVGVRLVRSALE